VLLIAYGCVYVAKVLHFYWNMAATRGVRKRKLRHQQEQMISSTTVWGLQHPANYFRCYTVHIVELLNYYTNYCTYIKFIKFTH